MSQQNFNQAPTVLTLQQLIAPSLLIDNVDIVRKAVRLYVILHSLYAPEPPFPQNKFRYRDWRDFFFEDAAESHRHRDHYPHHHESSQCPCQKNIKELMFSVNPNEKWEKWKQDFISTYQFIASLKQIDLHQYLDKLEAIYPLWLTGKAMQSTFQKDLTEKGWLLYQGNQKYEKLEQLPYFTPLSSLNLKPEALRDSQEELRLNFLLDDLRLITENFEKPINGIQRLFFHTDYQIPAVNIAHKVYQVLNKLKEIWQQKTVPIIQITYQSSHLKAEAPYTIYPVCIYYYQRSFYLCAFGESPRKPRESDWYNYRLDRVTSITTLDQTQEYIPQEIRATSQAEHSDQERELIQKDETYNGPLIEKIQESLNEAYGFDFYFQLESMILRFPYEYDRHYIQNTTRHQTFRAISHEQVIQEVHNAPLTKKQKAYLKTKVMNFKNDGFYRLNYRKHEYNVMMRLRSWCPNVEVILPWELREHIKEDIYQAWKLYKADATLSIYTNLESDMRA